MANRTFGGDITSIATGMEDTLPGTTDTAAPDQKYPSVDPDADYPGNVVGCLSQPVSLGRGAR